MLKYSKSYYKQYIAKHYIKELIEKLLQDLQQYLAYHKNSKLQKAYDVLILLSAQWENIQQEDIIDIIDDKLAKTERAKIRKGLLDIINNLPNNYFDFFNNEKKSSPPVSTKLQKFSEIEKPKKKGQFTRIKNFFLHPKTKKILVVGLILIMLIVGSQVFVSKISKQRIIRNLERNMKAISTGSFTMGCTFGGDCLNQEKPSHDVTVQGFKINKYEVTQEEWNFVMGNNPSHFKNCDKCPVENISWDDTQDFIKKLNQLTNKNYRLPSEAEWEYAARGGEKYRYAGRDYIDKMAWYRDNSDEKTHPVGQKQDNGFGLYDMSGNVWEWCQDTWHRDYNGAPTNGKAWEHHTNVRVYRGGGWKSLERLCYVTMRAINTFDGKSTFIGFRLAHD